MTNVATYPERAVLLACGAVVVVTVTRLAVGLLVGLVGRIRVRRGSELRWLRSPAARRWLGAGFGLALAVTPRSALAGETPDPTSAVMVPLDPAPPPTTGDPSLPDATSGDPTSAVMVALDPPSPEPPPAGAPIVPLASSSPLVPSSDAELWSVAPGEHLWHIAEQTLLEQSSGVEVLPDAEIARYVVRLVELNRDLLPDPQNPDLIYPGQVLRLA